MIFENHWWNKNMMIGTRVKLAVKKLISVCLAKKYKEESFKKLY